jgi:hypothetical protein
VVVSGSNRIVVYQPQVDSWDGFRVEGRAAVSVTDTSKADSPPAYGIVTMSAQANVDKDARLVILDKLTLKSASFPGAANKGVQWASVIQSSTLVKPIALERFEAAVAVAAARQQSASVSVKNDPPAILISTVPSMLLLVDGEPVFRDVRGTSMMRVVNTRPLFLRSGAGALYLKIFDGWMQAPALTGPWTVAASVPHECGAALKAAIDQQSVDLLVGGDPNDPKSAPSLKKQAPRIFVETTPAELLVFDGEPTFVPIAGTQLIYADNTTGHVFVKPQTQKAYVLVTGRWFEGPSTLQGPWQFVPGGDLPNDFARIPDDSPVENVKASITGTEQAQEAVVANSVPQTAKVKRNSAKFAPQFDGAPKLESVQGTSLKYVANSSLPIVAVGEPAEYFGVQNAVWFVSNHLQGPWLVATTVPSVIYSIPPSSPLHYITYVRVYDADPEYVVVGYTPGYSGVYVSGGCIVYGTGFVYTPWVGSVWYGPPVTYGFGVGVAYTPWTGWHAAFGLGWTWGPTVAVGWGWGPYPWWGAYGWGVAYPWVYRPGGVVAWGPYGAAAAWGPGYWAGTTGNVYSRWGATTAVTRTAGGYNAWTGNRWAGQVGTAYNSHTGVAAAGQRGVVGNVYNGNYAAGSRGAAVDTRTGAAVAGRSETIGNAYTGREATARQGVVRGPGGEVETANSIRGDEGGVARVGNNVYAGHDGQVYRNTGDGWQQYHPEGGWSPAGGLQDEGRSRLDGERSGRIKGNWRTGAAQSGGYYGGRSAEGRARGGRR